jgi:hypothetical protein
MSLSSFAGGEMKGRPSLLVGQELRPGVEQVGRHEHVPAARGDVQGGFVVVVLVAPVRRRPPVALVTDGLQRFLETERIAVLGCADDGISAVHVRQILRVTEPHRR